MKISKSNIDNFKLTLEVCLACPRPGFFCVILSGDKTPNALANAASYPRKFLLPEQQILQRLTEFKRISMISQQKKTKLKLKKWLQSSNLKNSARFEFFHTSTFATFRYTEMRLAYI